jgi:oxepin-CoA hydrolase/3-oxo-5,6-dehydrosuberyl-CoA semialdehyde dehydrogenase
MIELESHLEGKWVRGRGPGATLVNPATEEPLAAASTEGLDLAAALRYARRRGGPALRALSFRERGELLRAMSRAVHAHRDELIALAIANGGNTRSDAKFDVDGASGTLAAYADLAAELGDGRLLLDGEPVQLGRSPRLVGQHAWGPRHGAAVHLNAFNFPAWGLAEKAAAALLAGMPVLCKPATSTALVAWRLARVLAAERILPEGAFSFLAGGAGDLLDHLEGQDVVAFTGGSATGRRVRSAEAVLARGVRVNVEADSLNAAVLGPDVEEGSEVMNQFLGDVVRDITQKAGQKCTAIRRVLVPSPRLDAVLGLLRERLSQVKVGDPAREETGMGPLATRAQLADARAGLAELGAGAEVASGDPKAEVPGKGFFLAPALLASRSPAPGDAVHRREVFGPVATAIPYDGTAAQAAEIASWAGGSLVASVYSDDREFLAGAIAGLAPWHGRLVIGSSKTAAQAIPPGTVLPQLVHGGPGRAGPGEELGGRRGLALYMQRTALQGDRALVALAAGGIPAERPGPAS